MRSAVILCLFPGLCLIAQSSAGSREPAGLQHILEAAAAAQQHGDLKTAIEDYRKALQLRPEMVPVRIELASALLAAGQPDAAIAEDAKILKVDSANIPAQINAATAYFRAGDVDRARYLFELIHKAHPANVNAAMGLAYVYIKMQRGGEAAELLAPLELANTHNTDFQYVLGYAQILSGNDAEGIPRMESVARQQHSANAWMIAASTLFQTRKFAQARDDAEQAIALNPQLPGAQTLAGQSRYALGDIDKSIPEFQAALRQNPRDFTANLYLGIIRENQRDFSTARPLLELAVELLPDHPLAGLELARLNAKTGHEKEAIEELERLEKQTPQWLDPHVLLATLYYEANRPADGRREREIIARIQAQQQAIGPHHSE